MKHILSIELEIIDILQSYFMNITWMNSPFFRIVRAIEKFKFFIIQILDFLHNLIRNLLLLP